jgi:uncharacterized membrane protein YhaH (DUF805 family)
MSWGEIFFGFHGRINRKTFWLAWILVNIAGALFIVLLAYLATGNPLSPDVWRTPADKARLWAPVWLASLAFLAWPLAALAIKRLHDRSWPGWIWYIYYGVTVVFSLPPLRNAAGPELSAVAGAGMLALFIFGIFIFFELAVLRGTPGPNEFGEDTLPSAYYGGDYSFLSLMLALEGRISRAKWWYGIVIVLAVITAASAATSAAVGVFLSRHPGLEQNLYNPEWVNSPEAAPLLFNLGLWTLLPVLAFMLALWSIVALGVKRLHDRGLSSWLILVVVLPFLGALIVPALAEQLALAEDVARLALLLMMASVIWSVLQFGILKGETGPNQHGPDPLAGRE